MTRISVGQEALRSFLLAHSPPAQNVTKQAQGGKCVLVADDVHAHHTINTLIPHMCHVEINSAAVKNGSHVEQITLLII